MTVWVHTNCRERHLKRDGKIIGKIQRDTGESQAWERFVNSRPRRVIGHRRGEWDAKMLVETELGVSTLAPTEKPSPEPPAGFVFKKHDDCEGIIVAMTDSSRTLHLVCNKCSIHWELCFREVDVSVLPEPR